MGRHKSFSAVVVLFCVIITFSVSNFALAISDPEGDTFGQEPAQIDVIELSAEHSSHYLYLTARFATPIYPAGSGMVQDLHGFIELDVDQDPDTVFPGMVEGLGVDFALILHSVSDGMIDLHDFGSGTIAKVPIVFDEMSFMIKIPLSLLGDDDGLINFYAEFANPLEPTDRIPNRGFGSSDFGYLDYKTISYPNVAHSTSFSINNDRQIFGWFDDFTYPGPMGFILEDGHFDQIIDSQSLSMTPYGSNNLGLIVGGFDNYGKTQGFLFQKGEVYSIEPPGVDFSKTYDINDLGDIVGFYYEDGRAHGFLYIDENYEIIDYPSAHNTYLKGINNANQIVGWYDDGLNEAVGFLYDDHIFIPIQFPGAVSTHSFDINNAGQVVGDYIDESGNYHGFIFDVNHLIYRTFDFQVNGDSRAFSINDAGDILGEHCEEYECASYVAYDGSTVLIGGFDTDGDIDGGDFATFSSHYIVKDIKADLTNDGKVDAKDLELFALYFGKN